MDLNIEDVLKRYSDRVAVLTHEIILLETQVQQLQKENERLQLTIDQPPPSEPYGEKWESDMRTSGRVDEV